MSARQFDPKEYANLKRRIQALEDRIALDTGNEQAQAKKLLPKLLKKLEDYEKQYQIPKQPEVQSTNIHTSSWDFYSGENTYNFKIYVYSEEPGGDYQEDTRSEAEMLHDLGILYAIFGSTYQTVLNYHVYKIRFKKQTTREHAFYRVYSDIYEDNVRICKNVIIGFWPYHLGDDKCGDMEFSCTDYTSVAKYANGYNLLYKTLLDGLMDIWNMYFDTSPSLPRLPGPTFATLQSGKSHSSRNMPDIQLTPEHRQKMISKVENDITTGKMHYFLRASKPLLIMAYKPFRSLSELLENAGVVYKVDSTGVYIWDYFEKKFGQLVGYEHLSKSNNYVFYLL